MRKAAIIGLALLLSACAGTVPQPATHTPLPTPPSKPAKPTTRMPTATIAVMPGLESVLGQTAPALIARFGPPRLDVQEADARKLQWSGTACVLDIYFYPLGPGRAAQATYLDARRGDGRDVDRVACVSALTR